MNQQNNHFNWGTKTQISELIEIKEPTFYHVVLLNDDYTKMDFVISILVMIFQKNHQQAYDITMQIHNNGNGIAGTYTKEIAESKCHQVHKIAVEHHFPLGSKIEKV
ncbi:MAG: ATP-dependent Clp protease adaptor ClpS [Ostreibacterium sp.]